MVNKLEKCLHPMLAKRDQKWFCHKIQAEMQKQGLGYLILQAPYNVFYATGYTSLVGSSAAVIPAEGDVHLLISTLESADAYASTQDVDVREFMSWVFIDNGTEESRRDKGDVMDPDAIIHICLDLIKNTPMDGKVGIEMGSVTHHSTPPSQRPCRRGWWWMAPPSPETAEWSNASGRLTCSDWLLRRLIRHGVP